MIRLEGILSPVVTPFADSGDIDLDAFASNIAAHVANGVSGIVVTGSTGEAALLDDDERAALTERARRTAPAGVTILAGTGSESTRATIARTKTAASVGADGVLVVAPHYYADQMSSTAIREHYLRVADASPVPVLIYTIPKYMHFAVPPDVVADLSRHENIVGMKDSKGDPALFERYMESQGPSFKVFTGSGALWHKALCLGATGGILAASLFAPGLCFEVWERHHQGDHDGAERAQAILTTLSQRIISAMGVPGVKAAVDRVGLIGRAPRSPLCRLNDGSVAELEELLRGAELTAAA